MVEYRTDEERVAAIVRFIDNYKTYIIWSSVGLTRVSAAEPSVSSDDVCEGDATPGVLSRAPFPGENMRTLHAGHLNTPSPSTHEPASVSANTLGPSCRSASRI